MADFVVLKGESVDEITLLDSGNQYKKGPKTGIKTYSRFRHEGVVFTADDDSEFAVNQREGTLSWVKLQKGTITKTVTNSDGTEEEVEAPSLQYDSCGTFIKELNRAKHTFALESVRKGAALSAEALAAMEAAVGG